MSMEFTIRLAPVTKKNSQQIVRLGNRYAIVPSKAYKAYEKAALLFIPIDARQHIKSPVEVKALFYMPTRRKVDLTNLLEALDDILVVAGVLEDDNCKVIVSHDGSRVYYDKATPRTEVTVRRCKATFEGTR